MSDRRIKAPEVKASAITPPSSTVAPSVWRQCLMLWIGWLVPQVILFWPALMGQTVLCPADLLATPRFYLPAREEYAEVEPRDNSLADLILFAPAAREFCAAEFRAGRLPMWQPANYIGAPFATWPKYSPFELPYMLWPSPFTLVWMQLLQAICSGSGLYLFLRRAVGLPFWPAAVASWCFPLTGFMVLWQGFPVTAPVCWLPWLLWAVDATIQRPFRRSNLGLVVTTCLLLLSGQSDVGGLALLTSGLYALWLIVPPFIESRDWRSALTSSSGVACGWILGFLLAAPYFLPLYEYSKTGARMQARAEGVEERPPVGVAALPPVLLPDAYGSTRRSWLRIVPGSQLESSSGAYAGLVATLWLAPLAWSNPRRRRATLFWSGLAVLSLGWQLDLPGLVSILRLPILNLLSYSRWVFVTGMSALVLAAIGLEQLEENQPLFRRWFLVPMTLAVAFGVWCLSNVASLPEPVRSELPALVRAGKYRGLSMANVITLQMNFTVCYEIGAILSLMALVGWAVTIRGVGGTVWGGRLIPLVLLSELLWFASHEIRQADPALYFPRVEALEALAKLPRERMLGVRCLPPNLNQSHGLWDIRGYDAVDPAGIVKLLERICDPRVPQQGFAKTQWFEPEMVKVGEDYRVPPILNLLNVRHFVLRVPPPVNFEILNHTDDYWVVKNNAALPRAFVPRAIVFEPDESAALEKMIQPNFDPRELAFLHADAKPLAACAGHVVIRSETPTRLELDVEMETEGVVILSDQWDAGWQARLDGDPIPILRANVALRAMQLPAGRHQLELTYRPAGLVRGVWLALTGGLISLAWSGILWIGSFEKFRRLRK